MKKISDTIILNESILKSIGTNLKAIDLETAKVSLTRMEDSIKAISKKETRPLKSRVLNDLRDELVIPVYDPDGPVGSIPVFMPIWISSYKGKVVAVVNLTERARVDKKTGEVTVYPKTLFSLLLAASVIRQLHINEHAIMGSTKLLTSLARIYSKIFTKILDKQFAISANELYLDQIRYLTAKFFLISVVGRPATPMTNEIAIKSAGSSPKASIIQVDSQMPVGSYSDLNSFNKGLSEVFKRLAKLNSRIIVGEAVRTYSGISMLIFEYCPYLVANILFAVTSAGINNEYSYESVLDKDGVAVYSELARLLQ